MQNVNTKFNIIIPPQDISCEVDCLQRLGDGDRDAFTWVYKNYCKKVYDYAMMITNNKQLSEDLVQEVFIRLWIKRKKLLAIENFNAYLYTLYRNLLLNTIKKQQKEINVRKKYFFDAETVTTAKEMLDYKEKYKFFETVISDLPKQQQIVFRLSKDYGWKRTRIAKELNVSPFTVKNHMQKAMGKLKKKMVKSKP